MNFSVAWGTVQLIDCGLKNVTRMTFVPPAAKAIVMPPACGVSVRYVNGCCPSAPVNVPVPSALNV